MRRRQKSGVRTEKGTRECLRTSMKPGEEEEGYKERKEEGRKSFASRIRELETV